MATWNQAHKPVCRRQTSGIGHWKGTVAVFALFRILSPTRALKKMHTRLLATMFAYSISGMGHSTPNDPAFESIITDSI